MGSLSSSTNMASLSSPLPYWQVNVPPSSRTPTCPAYLLNLSAKDISILSTPDSAYTLLSWPVLQSHIAHNRLDVFQRTPSSLRRYLSFNHATKLRYGSVMQFVLRQKLGWEVPLVAEGGPFEKETDLKVMWNDWPYGVDPRIVHLVVWTKFVFEDDPVTGDLTEGMRGLIEGFVERVFRGRCGGDNVIWFRNWASLKSVHSVEHFHVMLFDPDPEFIDEVTNGGVPLFRTKEFGEIL